MKTFINILILTFVLTPNHLYAQEKSDWDYDLGISFFKTSLNNQPDEILFNPVFEKWESINHRPDLYDIPEYKALDPYPFNLCLGADMLIVYKKYFMLKIGYSYSNTLGIGGKENITYADRSDNIIVSESKTISYSSHQLNYFIGPYLPINDNGAAVYMGFSMMSPTYVVYKEGFKKTENGITVEDYNKIFTGFFGNCRSVIGMKVPISEKFRFGSELVFAYFNGIELKSGNLTDEGFKFPSMQWNFSFRYHLE